MAGSDIRKKQANKNYICTEIKNRRNSGCGFYQWVHICRITRLLKENIQNYNIIALRLLNILFHVKEATYFEDMCEVRVLCKTHGLKTRVIRG